MASADQTRHAHAEPPPTPFISFLPPSPSLITLYNPHLPPASQEPDGSSSIPPTFIDAMAVRQAVFVKEQGIPLEHEFDDDDSRSCHWVTYASDHDEDTGETRRVPTGTVRAVPFPHPPHPLDGGVYVDSKLVNAAELHARYGEKTTTTTTTTGTSSSSFTTPEQVIRKNGDGDGTPTISTTKARPTTFHDGAEPYVKLGRLAVTPSFRGKKQAHLLVRTALAWLATHPSFFGPSLPTILEPPELQRPVPTETLVSDIASPAPRWNGLVCVHAQEQVARFWASFGFRVDEGMGRWLEEGIPHVGMFLRLDVVEEREGALVEASGREIRVPV